jgi:hypothetical protein
MLQLKSRKSAGLGLLWAPLGQGRSGILAACCKYPLSTKQRVSEKPEYNVKLRLLSKEARCAALPA